jgi:hypothetical protein
MEGHIPKCESHQFQGILHFQGWKGNTHETTLTIAIDIPIFAAYNNFFTLASHQVFLHHSTCGKKSRHLIVWRKHQLPNCSKLSNPPQVFLAINGLATMPIPVKFNGYILTCDQVRFRPAKTKKDGNPKSMLSPC